MTHPASRPGSWIVARPLAKAATARDAARLAAHEDAHRYGWRVEYDGELRVTVTLQARAAHYVPEQSDAYVITLDCESYDVWPPEVHFVNPSTRDYVVGRDAAILPNINGVYGFGLHANFSNFYEAGRSDQLVCFSFARGYYDSSHSPQEHERWRSGRHWLYSTVQYLHRALQPPYYIGRSSV